MPTDVCMVPRSTLTDMVAYTQAALRADAKVSPECRSTARSPPPDASICLIEDGDKDPIEDVLQLLGYEQQRQHVRGSKVPFQCKSFDDVAEKVEQWIALGKKKYGAFSYFLNGVIAWFAGAVLLSFPVHVHPGVKLSLIHI